MKYICGIMVLNKKELDEKVPEIMRIIQAIQ